MRELADLEGGLSVRLLAESPAISREPGSGTREIVEHAFTFTTWHHAVDCRSATRKR
jgi:hypothetical protein